MTSVIRERLIELLSSGPNLNPDFHADHHLFRRGRVWHAVLTVHTRSGSKRVQRSLHTRDIIEARDRRDLLIDELIEQNRIVPLHARRRAR